MNMNKEQQDKLWNELSEESKKMIKEDWQMLQEAKANNDLSFYGVGKQDLYKDIFGEHNLNPKPQIKTWEDVNKYYKDKGISTDYYVNFECGMGERIADKMIATAKIAKLIDLGYGGMVSEEEWEDEYKSKWVINCDMSKETRFEILEMFVDKFFIAFHEESQAEEFMSHESNKILVRQYYLM